MSEASRRTDGLATRCVHSGGVADDLSGGLNTPIFASSAFDYLDREEVVYPRYFNAPNQRAVEEKLAALEGAEAGVVFSSGMAAISSTLLTLLKPGDHVLLQDQLYGGTHQLVTGLLEPLGVTYTFGPTDAEALASLVTDRTRVIYLESPTNPLLQVVDLPRVAAAARARGVVTMIDSTFATPINQRPIELGIDVVVHSGTKYLGGHSDLCCGAVLTQAERVRRIRATACLLGGSLNALSCYLLERSLKTLDLRVQRQTESAARLAAWLSRHARIGRVYYPGLASHPGHGIARRQMTGFGAMLSFELVSSGDPRRFLQRLQLIRAAVSLGGVETTICAPAATSHVALSADERSRLGISDRLLRLSVGIEDVADLERDLDQALSY